MNWAEYLDEYCERLAPGLLNEPLNFFSNASFFIVAIIFILKCRQFKCQRKDICILAWLIFTIGIGSALFHSFATRWSKFADIIPIGIFILVFIYFAFRNLAKWNLLMTAGGYLGFVVISFWCAKGFDPIYFNNSNMYFGTFFSTFLLAFIVKDNKVAARNLVYSAIAFGTALTFRTIDPRVCSEFPNGTHFMWHLFNGLTIYFAMRAYVLGTSRTF